MATRSRTNARERILQAARRLFAEKGYAATGLREIVREAGVSVAMVNYHFGTKKGLLQELIAGFLDNLHTIADASFAADESPEEMVRAYFRRVVDFLRDNMELVRITATEFPRDIPDMAEFRASRLRRIVEIFMQRLLPKLPEEVRARIRLEVAGPAAMGMLIGHFLVRPVVELVFGTRFDDRFYQGYADALADLFLHGMLHQPAADQPRPEEG